jgi:hypothetical protein
MASLTMLARSVSFYKTSFCVRALTGDRITQMGFIADVVRLALSTNIPQCMSNTRVQGRLTRRKAHPPQHAVRPKFQFALLRI